MAAHVVTGLNDVIEAAEEGHKYIIDQLRAALNISTWTEDLTLAEWRAFDSAVQERDLERIGEIARLALPGYEAEWEELGRPSCREDWYRAKYPDLEV